MKDEEPLIKKVYSRKYPIAMDIVIGDIHVGHKTGIASDKYLPDDYVMNAGQQWLLGVFRQRFIPKIKQIIKAVKPNYIHGELGGDMGDMDYKNRSSFYWSKKATEISENAVDLLTPLIELFDSFHAVKGTKSHTGGELDQAIALNFDNCAGVSYEVSYILEDVFIEARHKGKNKAKWADENLLNGLRSEIILSRASQKTRIPDVSYRHHFHWYGATPDYKPYRVFSIPSWQLPYDNDYIAEIDAVGGFAHVGGFVALYQKGQMVDEFPLLYTYPKERPWKLK